MVLDAYTRDQPRAPSELDEETTSDLMRAVKQQINTEFEPRDVLSPDDGTKARIIERIRFHTQNEIRKRGMGALNIHIEQDLAKRIQHQMLGLGFLEPILDRGDVSEIMMNQDGSLWLMMKGQVNAVEVHSVIPDFRDPSVNDVEIVIDKLLGQVNRRVNEAEPIVAAKIPRTPRLPAGARVNVIIPPIANGPYPEMNIRLYEAKPVTPEQLLAWGEMNEELMEFLRTCVQRQMRIVIAGGTTTGKTTLLSCLVGFIPEDLRIVFIEDPAEIFVEHPHVVSLEARPGTVQGLYGVSVGSLVTTAMRMSPRWLVVGEVRHGDAAVWLMRAQMSDHPGMSTIHADNPKSAVETLCLLASIDNTPPVRYAATKTLIARAIDIFVQIGIDPFGVRRITRVTQVAPELKGGEVWVDDIYRYDEKRSTMDKPVWEKVGELTRDRTLVGVEG
jgi:pilus assembly protein CpaF